MTTETEMAKGRLRHGRFLKWSGILAGAAVMLWAYYFLSNKILPIERIDQVRWGSVENAERYFNREFPTAKNIQSYLSNATILVSHPPGGNAVYFFDAPYHFLKWRNFNTSATDVLSGTWSIDWHLLPMEFNGQWRIALEYVICTRSPDSQPPDAPFCHDVQTLSPLLQFGRNPEYRAGNIFNLVADGDVPFPLPTKTNISIDELLAMETSPTKQ